MSVMLITKHFVSYFAALRLHVVLALIISAVDGTLTGTHSTRAVINSTVRLTCTANTGEIIQWQYLSPNEKLPVTLHNGNQTNPTLVWRFTVDYNKTAGRSDLIISRIKQTDSGKYICTKDGASLQFDIAVIVDDQQPSPNCDATPLKRDDNKQKCRESAGKTEKLCLIMMYCLVIGCIATTVIVSILAGISLRKRARGNLTQTMTDVNVELGLITADASMNNISEHGQAFAMYAGVQKQAMTETACRAFRVENDYLQAKVMQHPRRPRSASLGAVPPMYSAGEILSTLPTASNHAAADVSHYAELAVTARAGEAARPAKRSQVPPPIYASIDHRAAAKRQNNNSRWFRGRAKF